MKHHVTLSVVGADRVPENGYFHAKVAQEGTAKTGSVPYTILRAAQFFEFIGRIVDSSTEGDTVRLAPVFIQPEAADDVASALAEVAVGDPVNGTVELAGPEEFPSPRARPARAQDEQRTARGHHRHPRPYFGAELNYFSLTPEGNARIAPTRFEHWLKQSAGA